MEWKKFKVGDIFSFTSTKKMFHANAVVIENQRTDSNYPYIVRTSRNNGLRGYITADKKYLNPGNTISFAQDTAQVFYQKEPFFTGNNVKVMSLKNHELNEEIALFLVTCLGRSFSGFKWGSSYKTSTLENVVLSLPVDDAGNIDWNYMQERIAELEQERIAELEQERIAELEQYLVATGLNDYTLTDEDREALATWLTDADRVGQSRSSIFADGCLKEVREIPLGELFASSNGDFDIQKKHLNGRGIDVVSAGVTDSGFIGKTDVEAKIFDGNTITIDMFGNCFYRSIPYKMATHARVFSLSCNDERFNELNALYIVSLIRKRIGGIFGYSNMCSWSKTKDMSIKLPVDGNGDPDWDFMSRYIRAVEKVVIKDVVDWKDEQIAAMKTMVA